MRAVAAYAIAFWRALVLCFVVHGIVSARLLQHKTIGCTEIETSRVVMRKTAL
jgi:hypothetical protein